MQDFNNIVGHVWYGGTICIMVYHDEYDGLQAYIKNTSGQDEPTDLMATANYGNKFPLEDAISVITKHGKWHNTDVLKLIKEKKEK